MAQGARRKLDHLEICAQQDVQSSGAPRGLYGLRPEALPDLDLEEVDLRARYLGREFASPLLITGMTGGVKQGGELNLVLAREADRRSIPMGLGSMRLALEHPEASELFDVKREVPNVFLIGNLGLAAFREGVGPGDIEQLVRRFRLDAFAFHLNALQECIQPEGRTRFGGLCKSLEEVIRKLPVPVIVKEVGSGMTGETFARLSRLGAAAVDVGGKGGTSWSVIEGSRGPANSQTRRLGELFRNWGLTTLESVEECAAARKATGSSAEILATGGMWDGLRAASALALGASGVGIGLPVMRAALSPPPGLTPQEAVGQELDFVERGLRIAVFCSGARCPADVQVHGRGQ